MAKRNKNDEGGGKIKVLFVELEGSDETLQESLRAVANAFRPLPAPAPSRAVPITSARSVEALPEDTNVIDVEEAATVVEPTNKRGTKSSSSQRRPPKPPKLIEGLDIKAGDVSLKAYVEQKSPKTDTDKYILIADWLKRNQEISQVKVAHVYTCYKLLGWAVPNDLRSPFRNEAFIQEGQGLFGLSILGENKALEMGTPEG